MGYLGALAVAGDAELGVGTLTLGLSDELRAKVSEYQQDDDLPCDKRRVVC
jgi:hypothetical protein